MGRILLAIIVLSLSISIPAETENWKYPDLSSKYFAAIGRSEFKPHGSGVWYIDEQPYTINNKDLAWTFGLRGKNWRVGYLNLGKETSDALFYSPDPAYLRGALNGCASLGCAPLDRGVGEFKVEGFYYTYEPSFHGITFGFGPALLHHTYTEIVNLPAGPNPYLPGGYQNVELDRMYIEEWRFSYLFTVGFETENFFVNYQWFPKADGTNSIFENVNVFFVGVKF